jgi:hypothetical protein
MNQGRTVFAIQAQRGWRHTLRLFLGTNPTCPASPWRDLPFGRIFWECFPQEQFVKAIRLLLGQKKASYYPSLENRPEKT